MALSDDERVAWAVLALADTFEEMLNNPARRKGLDGDSLEVAMAADVAARLALRDRFGINLDVVFDKAQDAYDKLRDSEKTRLDGEKAKRREMEERLAELEKKIAKDPSSGGQP